MGSGVVSFNFRSHLFYFPNWKNIVWNPGEFLFTFELIKYLGFFSDRGCFHTYYYSENSWHSRGGGVSFSLPSQSQLGWHLARESAGGAMAGQGVQTLPIGCNGCQAVWLTPGLITQPPPQRPEKSSKKFPSLSTFFLFFSFLALFHSDTHPCLGSLRWFVPNQPFVSQPPPLALISSNSNCIFPFNFAWTDGLDWIRRK